jgi:chromosome segregation ATPase
MRLSRVILCTAGLIAAIAVLAHDRNRELSYIYVLDGGKQQILSGGSLNIENLVRITKRYGGRYFWFSLEGDSYVIRDAATLAEIDRNFASVRALDPQRDDIRRRLEPLEREERILDRKVDTLEDSIEDDEDEAEPTAKVRSVQAQVRELERRLDTIEEQMRVIEREEERLDRKIDALEEEAERQLIPILRKAIKDGRAART